jgi:tetratricopeptide (TPR) repeat protein
MRNGMKEQVAQKDLYSRAVDFYAKGKFENAEKCCKKAISENPNHFEAYNVLGAILQNRGNSGEAFAYVQKALAINPAYERGYNNLGSIYFANKSYDEAIACFNKALAINNSNADAHYNIATALQIKGNLAGALEFYKNAIRLNPQYSKAYHNLGSMLIKQGYVQEGVEYYRAAIANDDKFLLTDVYVNFSNMIFYTDGVAAWRDTVASYLKSVNFPAGEKGGMYTSLATACWIMGDVDKCIGYLDIAKKLLMQNFDYPNFKQSIIFHDFIRSLVLWYRDNPENNVESDNTLYFIGDSHSVTCANKTITLGSELYKCSSRLIKGCKMWHLVSDENNEFKLAFDREINSLPENSTIVFTLGEIDCRHDSGLFLRYRKYGTDLYNETNILLDKYFLKIMTLVKDKRVTPLIWGVPAPHDSLFKSAVHHLQQKEFINFILYFNQQLSLRAKTHNLQFIDNYKLTANDIKQSDKSTHLDDIHLKPSVFVRAIQDLWQ